MFGGPGRLSHNGSSKFRTSYPLHCDSRDNDGDTDTDGADMPKDVRRRRSDGAGGGVYYEVKTLSHRHSVGGVPTAGGLGASSSGAGAGAGEGVGSASLLASAGCRSEGNTPTKPPKNPFPAFSSPQGTEFGHGLAETPVLDQGNLISIDALNTSSTAVSEATAGAGTEATPSTAESAQSDSVLFTQSEIMGLRLMFSLFDRCVPTL